jgi:calcineurin-like phosphoesterase family protein
MLKVLKVSQPNHEVAFVSDLHWGHDRDFIWGKRGFGSVGEHDEELIHRWNSVCTSRSTVFHLGDICFNDGNGEKLKALLRRLNFRALYCLLGNHNSGQSQLYKNELAKQFPNAISANGYDFHEVYPLWHNVDADPNKQVCFLPEYVEAYVNGQRMTLCHFPIVSHHKAGHGAWMICGHSHGSCEFTNTKTGKGKLLDIGIESFGKPLTFNDLKDFFSKREVISFDHHSDKTT